MCFCWQGVPTPKVTDHTAKNCVLLKKFDTKQATQKFQPICLKINEIVADTTKEPISAEEVSEKLVQVVVKFEDKLAKMNRCLKSLEKSLALQHKCKSENTNSDPWLAKQQKGSTNNAADKQEPKSPKKEKKQTKKAKKAKKGKDVAP